MKLHIKIEVEGKVQGVWYRASTKEKADELDVFGYVENQDNGSVYIEAEGEIEQLEEFIAWCKIGPEKAEVRDVVVLQYEELKHYDSFEIRRKELL